MRAKIIYTFIVLLGLLCPIPSVIGQDTASLPIITPENVSEIVPISALESPYLGDMVWSNDGNWITVGTSHEGVHIFDANNLAASPINLEGNTEVMFSPSGEQLISNGIVQDIATQQGLFTIGDVDYKQFSPDGRYVMTAKRTLNQTDFTLYEISTGETVYTFEVDAVQEFNHLIFSDDLSRYALIFRIPHQPFTPQYSERQDNSFIQVRDTANGMLVTTLEVDYQELNVIFSNEDQYLVALNSKISYGASPSKLIIWDITQQSRVREFDTYDQYTVFSPDSRWFFVGIFNEIGTLDQSYIVSLDSGQSANLIEERLEFERNSIHFSPDGHYVGIRYRQFKGDVSEHGIAVWSIEALFEQEVSEPPAKYVLETTMGPVDFDDFEFQPDSQILVVANGEDTVLWDIETETIQQTIPDSGQLHFTADGYYLRIDNARTWEISKGTVVSETPIYTGQYSPDGRYATILTPDTLSLLDIVSGEETVLPILDNYLGQIVTFDGENDLAIFQSDKLFVYDLTSGDELLQLNPAPQGFTISDDGSILVAWNRSATSQTDLLLIAYFLRDNALNPVELEGVFAYPQFNDVIVSPDRQYILVTENDYQETSNQFYLYSLETGEQLVSWQEESKIYISVSIFSPDSQYVLIMAYLNTVEGDQVIEVTFWEISALLAESTQGIVPLMLSGYLYDFDISFNLDGDQLVVMTDDADLGDGPVLHNFLLTIFDWTEILAGNENLNSLTLRAAYNPIFNRNINFILTSGSVWSRDDGRHISYIFFWNNLTGELISSLADYSNPILNPDGTLIAALSKDKQMVVWDVASLLRGEQIPLITVDSPGVEHIAFSSNGDRIYQQTSYGVITLAVSPD
jgi:WD40 repeat protein